MYPFEHHHDEPRALVDLLGGKGANLAEMTSVLALPVPPGFTITTEACRTYRAEGWPAGLDAQVAAALERLETTVGRRFGDPDDPLLVSVRSGAARSMPGMLDTVLDLGLTPATVGGFARHVGERCAMDSYRRFITMYGEVVLGLDPAPFRQIEAEALARSDRPDVGSLGPDELEALCRDLLASLEAASGRPLPEPRGQLRAAIEAVFASWDGERARAYRRHDAIADDLGTAANVQCMVFGNRDANSGTGVAFSRNPATGEPGAYGDFLVQAQGQDVVDGESRTEDLDDLRRRFPEAHAEFLEIMDRLEAHYQDLCETEFTIESGRLWMLQIRVGKRTAAAAVRIAVDLVEQDSWQISPAEAVRRVRPEQLEHLARGTLGGGEVLATGLAASPGAATGRVCLSADACVDAVERGDRVLLVRADTSPEDVHGMQVAEGILTARGGLVSHAAVVARGWGIPAVVGAEALVFDGNEVRIGGVVLREGDVLSIDGTTGEIRRGAEASVGGAALPQLETLLGWADELSGEDADGRSPGERLLAAHAALDRRST